MNNIHNMHNTDREDFYMPEPMDFSKLPQEMQKAFCTISKFMLKTVKLLAKNAKTDDEVMKIAIMASLKAGIEFSSDIKHCENCKENCENCSFAHAKLLRTAKSLAVIPEHIQEEMLSDADAEINDDRTHNELKSALNDLKDYI